MQTPGGGCNKCEPSDRYPFIVALLVGFLFLILVTVFANIDVTTQHRTVATIVIVGGRLLTAARTMGIFWVLMIEWEEPLFSIMRAISLVAFDFDIIKVACILDDGEASVKLSLKLLVFPGFTLAGIVFYPVCIFSVVAWIT